MQMVPRAVAHHLGREQDRVVNPSEMDREEVVSEREREHLELARVRTFCSSILKALAPPLLQEFEKATGLRADAGTFYA
jgi:hypothetical protein